MANKNTMPAAFFESEKVLEKKLSKQVKELGGLCLKFVPFFVAGLPDRVCLMPGGKAVFVELKSTGKRPTLIQLAMHGRIKKLGFRVEVIDSTQKIKELLGSYE